MADTLTDTVPDDVDALACEVLKQACDLDLRLVTAESCTGGLLASLLTDVSGMSHAFERGFVSYTDEAKRELLGVDRTILDGPGAVSEAAARAMAEGALANSRADIGVSVTGFAGPAGPDDEPGLVHFAVTRRGGFTVHRMERFGSDDRGEVRLECLRTALGMLRTAMVERP